MPEFIPRSLVILTAVVALIALFIGVRDYLATKHEVRPAVSMSAKSAVQPDELNARKKIGPAKKRQAERSAAETPSARADAAGWDAASKSLIKDVLVKVDSTPDRRRIEEVQPLLNEVSSRSPSRLCAPLPNSTKPEDVDAIYYQGWAREYGCGAD